MKAPREVVKKSAFVAVGAPVVAARKIKELGGKMMTGAQTQIDEYATEGEKVTKQLKDRNVVEELEQRINIDKVQGRVEQLRDQLESTLNNWRESFAPEVEKTAAEPKNAPAAKKAPAKKAPVATKTTARKTTAKKAPAAKKTATASK
jgi:hypothetical protein